MSLMTAPPVPQQASEPALVDPTTAARRKKMSKRRKLMFWISLPFVILTLVFAAKLISLSLFTNMSISSYDERDYVTAVERLAPLDTFNRFEPYKVFFNRGTAQLKDRKFETSEKSLKKAVDLAPDEVVCDVRRNLAFVYSGQADAAIAKGNLLGSIRLLQKSIQTLDVPECAQDQATQDQKSDTEDKQNESKDKQEQKEQEQNGGEPGEPGGDPSQGGSGTDPGQGGTDPGTDPGQGGTDPGTDPGQGGTDPGTDPGQGGTDPGQGGTDPGTDPGGGTDPGTNPGGGTDPGTDPGAGGGGGNKKDELNDRNNQARQDRDKERQKSNTGKGPRRAW